MAGNAIETGRTVTSKVVAVLLIFTEGAEHSLSDIAMLTGMPISTTHRLVSELTQRRLLDKAANGLYRSGTTLRAVRLVEDLEPTLAQRAPCVLEDLTEVTRCRTRLGVLHDISRVLYIEKRPGPEPVTSFHSAATLPAHPMAMGRALLAFAPVGVVELAILQGFRPYTTQTVTAPQRFRRALAITRQHRLALTYGELELDTCGAAMPVFNTDGQVIAAIEVTFKDRISDLRHVVTALAIASRCLTRELAPTTRQTQRAATGNTSVLTA